jgi:mannose-6-phosphate isomerase
LDRVTAESLEAFVVETQYRERVWGGDNLRPAAEGATPIGEAWVVYEENRVASGKHEGRTLGELASEYGAALLGTRPLERTGTRFPVLIKLLDCNDWLSIQVHPDDAQAVELEGPGHFGKTEAWHILQAGHGARIIAGLKPGTTPDEMARAIREGTIKGLAEYMPLERGDTVLTRARTIHALGPGLFVYEVQQTSDITYRVYDWDRPQAAGRALHIEQSVRVSDPAAQCERVHAQDGAGDGVRRLVSSVYFDLALAESSGAPLELDTRGESFHAVTVIEGECRIESAGEARTLGLYETAVIPASCGRYRIVPVGRVKALAAWVD